jgi:hypothetical protein
MEAQTNLPMVSMNSRKMKKPAKNYSVRETFLL